MSDRRNAFIHGTDHSPRGSDPGATEPWRDVVTAGTGWSNLTNYNAGDTIDHGNLRWQAIQQSGPGHGGAIEPGVDAHTIAFWWCQASVFVNGANASPTGAIPNPVPLRYRLSVGAPNILALDGTVVTYTNHEITIQGDLSSSSLSYGETVFILPPEYRHDYDVPYHTHDDLGGFVPCRLQLVTGAFIWNTP